jgi:GxxExxY protein
VERLIYHEGHEVPQRETNQLCVMNDLGFEVVVGDTSAMATTTVSRLTAQQVSPTIITAAMKVHTELGPGLLESTCLQYELVRVGVQSATQVGLPVVYCGVKLELGYRMDLLAEDLVVVEIEAVSPVHQAQILSYLKLSGKSIGLLINFNVVHLKDGIRRFVNGTGWK